MQTNGTSASGPGPDINVTPLIDVLLVLLIIFMVIVPTLPRGLDSAIPQGQASTAAVEAPLRVTIRGDAADGELRYAIDEKEVPLAGLGEALTATLASHSDRTMFVRADRNLSYQQVAVVMGLGHAAGAGGVVLEAPAKP